MTGPAALTGKDISRITEAVTGQPLRWAGLDESACRQALLDRHTPSWLVDAFTSMFASVREGRFQAVSRDLEQLTHQPPQSYADVIRSAGIEPV